MPIKQSKNSETPMGPRDEVFAVFDKIHSIDPEQIEIRHGNRGYMRDRANDVRTLLKDLGIKHVGVRVPNYSMAHAIHINLPRVIFEQGQDPLDNHYRQQEAGNHLRKIILAAFPGFKDRSDPMTDYFDAAFYLD